MEKNDTFNRIGEKDKFSKIYNSLIVSDAFQDMPPTAKVVYLYCRNQAHSKTGIENLTAYLYETAKMLGYDEKQTAKFLSKYKDGYIYFTFPAKHAEELYNLDRRNLGKYLKILSDYGFIETVSCGKHQKRQNLYKFSDAWKRYKIK